MEAHAGPFVLPNPPCLVPGCGYPPQLSANVHTKSSLLAVLCGGECCCCSVWGESCHFMWGECYCCFVFKMSVMFIMSNLK